MALARDQRALRDRGATGPARRHDGHRGLLAVLADRLFWARPDSKRYLLGAHAAAAAALVVLVLAADWNLRASYRRPGQLLSELDGLARAGWAIAFLGALGVLAYVVYYLSRGALSDITGPEGMRETTPPSGWVHLAAASTVGVALLAMLRADPVLAPGSPPVMSSPGPAILALVVLGLALALSAWGFRRATSRASQALHLVVAVVVLGALVLLAALAGSIAAGIAAALLTAAIVVAHVLTDRAEAAAFAFNGRAAPVFMLVSLGFAVLLSSAATLAVGDWLNDCYAASDLTPGGESHVCLVPVGAGEVPRAAADLTAPAVYQMAAAFVLPCLAVALLVVGFWVWRRWAAPTSAAPRLVPGAGSAHGTSYEPDLPDVLAGKRHGARRFARFTARAEGLVGLFAAAILANLVTAVALGASAEAGNDDRGPVLTGFMSIGLAGAAFLVLALVGMLVGGTGTSGRRPLGLLWDLVCFLPRDGHPLAPPCYAERAVPELTGRVLSWLDADDLDTSTGVGLLEQSFLDDGGHVPDERAEAARARAALTRQAEARRVVLSGHSLGGVIAVASILQLEPGRCSSVSLLTYGSQLQAYFSRIFPALLGPSVLGVPAFPAARFWPSGPWPGPPLPAGWGPESVRCRLGGALPGFSPASDPVRWRNLWRATDPLGFPVDNGRWVQSLPRSLGPVDFGCDEIDTTGYMPFVGTHSDYPRTTQYLQVLLELRGPLDAVTP